MGTGKYIARIDSAEETEAKDRFSPWDDKTPQVAIKYKHKDQFITQWINLKGYMTKEDYGPETEFKGIVFRQHPFSKIWFAVDAMTGMRIESPIKSQTCLHILCRIGVCAGIPEDQTFTLTDLIGREIGIEVYNKKVIKTFKKL